MTLPKIAAIMKCEYDSPKRQIKVQAELETLCFDSFMEMNARSSISEGVGKLVREISAPALQASISFRNVEQKTRLFRRAILKILWAQNTISELSAMNFSFHQILTALREGLQFFMVQKYEIANPT